jgi:hypothetical protein
MCDVILPSASMNSLSCLSHFERVASLNLEPLELLRRRSFDLNNVILLQGFTLSHLGLPTVPNFPGRPEFSVRCPASWPT